MKKIFLWVLAALMLFFSGCIVAGPYYTSRGDVYYYYPEDEVYYYPRAKEYYWLEGGEWRHAARAPERYALRDPVMIESEGEPTRYHDRIRRDLPARRDRSRDQDQHDGEKPRT
jgi:hypothetical protein